MSNNVRFGFIKSLAQKGDRVTVYFDNGTSNSFIAQNDLTANKVAVIGDRVFSEDVSRSQLVRTTELFKSKNIISPDSIGCQLIAVSIVGGSISLNDIEEGTLGQLPSNARLVALTLQSGWNWYESSGYCRPTTDGSGEYDSLASCLANNQTSDYRYKISSSLLRTAAYHTYYYGSDNNIVCDRLFEIQSNETVKVIDIISYANFESYENYEGSSNDYTYMAGRVSSRSSWQNFDLNDGSVKEVFNGEIKSLRLSEFTKYKLTYSIRWKREKTLSFADAAAYMNNRRFSIEVDITKSSNYQGPYSSFFGNYASSYIEAYRNARADYQYNNVSYIDSYFLKLHDPDLPPVKVFDCHRYIHQAIYVVVTDKNIYAIHKTDKLYQPDKPVHLRAWGRITVVELAPSSIVLTEINRVHLINGANNDRSILDRLRNHPLFYKFGYFEELEDQNNCLDSDFFHYSDNKHYYMEVSYQNKNGILEYKIPGVVYGGD